MNEIDDKLLEYITPDCHGVILGDGTTCVSGKVATGNLTGLIGFSKLNVKHNVGDKIDSEDDKNKMFSLIQIDNLEAAKVLQKCVNFVVEQMENPKEPVWEQIK